MLCCRNGDPRDLHCCVQRAGAWALFTAMRTATPHRSRLRRSTAVLATVLALCSVYPSVAGTADLPPSTPTTPPLQGLLLTRRDGELAALRPQQPGIIDLYVLGVAGDADEDVFRNEVLYLRQLFERRFGAGDRPSFCCGITGSATWFGRAFLVEALNQTADFATAFQQAEVSVRHREQEQKETPSQPQISVGKQIGEVLARWRGGIESGAAVPYPFVYVAVEREDAMPMSRECIHRGLLPEANQRRSYSLDRCRRDAIPQ